jgi:hypothetical protein
MKKPTLFALTVLPGIGAAAAIGLAVPQDRPQEVKPQVTDAGFICPLTGETLPCPNCCPAKQD